MKTVDKDLIKKCANSLMFDMKEEEFDSVLNEFGIILKQMELINAKNDLKNFEPMNFPFEINTSFKEDFEIQTINKEDLLKTSKSTENGMIKIPSVITN